MKTITIEELEALKDAEKTIVDIRPQDTMPDIPAASSSSSNRTLEDNGVLDSLSDVQYEALRRWVEDGGTILFGGGVDCARNYGRFAEKVLEPPYLDAVTVPVSLGGETAPGEQTGEIHK